MKYIYVKISTFQSLFVIIVMCFVNLYILICEINVNVSVF